MTQIRIKYLDTSMVKIRGKGHGEVHNIMKERISIYMLIQ